MQGLRVLLPATTAAALLFAVAPAAAAEEAAATGARAGCDDAGGSDITGSDAIRVSLSDGRTRLSVTVRDERYRITAVGVKGGPDWEVYTSPPFTGLSVSNPGGNLREITDWFVCGFRSGGERPPPTDWVSPTPVPTPTATPPPSATPTPSPSRTPTATPTPTPTPSPTPSPTATTTPAPPASPVPTAIPAGGPAAGAASAASEPDRSGPLPYAVLGLAGGIAAAGWALTRRRRAV